MPPHHLPIDSPAWLATLADVTGERFSATLSPCVSRGRQRKDHMAQRRFLIERPTSRAGEGPVAFWVEVSDDQPIEPLVSTVAARFGYPLLDSFGAPIRYRLRSRA